MKQLLVSGSLRMPLSHSINLLDSGGQKQQVAIARAAYAMKQIEFFHDVFSGFENRTERKAFDCVFGPWGLLRRLETTTVLATHSPNPLPYAVEIIALLDGKITEKEIFIRSFSNGEAGDVSIDSEPQREETARLGKAIKGKTTKSSPRMNNKSWQIFSI